MQIETGSTAKVQVWRHAPPAGRRMPVPGGAPYFPNPESPAEVPPEASHATLEADTHDVAHSCATTSSLDEPNAPPSHVTRHVSAWQRQQALYKGALQPGVSADDSDLGVSALARSLDQQLPSKAHDGSASMGHRAEQELTLTQKSAGAAAAASASSLEAGEASLSHMQHRSAATGMRNAAGPYDSAAAAQAIPHRAGPSPSSQIELPEQHVVLAAQRRANQAARACTRSELLRRHASSALAPPASSPTPSHNALEHLLRDSIDGSQLCMSHAGAQPAVAVQAVAEPPVPAAPAAEGNDISLGGFERAMGGGAGLAGASQSGAAPQPAAAMSEITNMAGTQHLIGSTQQSDAVPVVHASRAGSAKVVPAAPAKRAQKLSPAMHARLQEKVCAECVLCFADKTQHQAFPASS